MISPFALSYLLHSIYTFFFILYWKTKHWILHLPFFTYFSSSPLLPSNTNESATNAAETDPQSSSLENRYIHREKERFIQIMNHSLNNSNNNTDSIFYDIKAYKEVMMTANNEIELKWKRNILFENTPRGNIIFFYDAFKKGFSYYSDIQSISYSILNAVAMKYTRVFSCVDLFMDDSVYPERPSPLILLEQEQEKKESETKKSNIPIDKQLLKKAPFAKLKKYNHLQPDNPAMSAASKSTNAGSESNTKQIQKNINRFLYLGKINNFSITQKIPKKKVVIQNVSTSYDNLFQSNHEIQKVVIDKETFSYKDYKRLISPKTDTPQ